MVLVVRTWHEVARAVDRSIGETLGRLGLTESTGAVLWALDPDAPPPTLRSLARTLDCDPSNASLISAKLEQEGLIQRRAHPTDRRSRVLVLTELGERLHARLIADVATLTPLRHLDPDQCKQLMGLLNAVKDAD